MIPGVNKTQGTDSGRDHAVSSGLALSFYAAESSMSVWTAPNSVLRRSADRSR